MRAQTSAPAAGTKEISEAARRQADSPYRFILQNSQIRERPKAAPEKAPAPEKEVKEARETVRETKRPAATEVASVPSRPAPQAAPEPVAAPSPAPAPVVAIAAPQAKPAPVVAVRKELVAIKQDPPELSPSLMRERPTGAVTVAFDVMPDGSVKDVKVIHSSNFKLNRPSVAAIQAWKFNPIDEVRQLEFDFKYD